MVPTTSSRLERYPIGFEEVSFDENQASGSSTYKLHLERRELTELPEEYCHKSENYDPDEVTHLLLLRNRLTDISFTTKFLHLTMLDVSFNRLTSLPKELSLLAGLKMLFARNNQLTELPQSLSHLTELASLNLAGNRFASFPEVILSFSALQNLHFGGNRLTALPERIGQLHSLDYFYLGGNALTTVPHSIGQLHQLRTLNLCDNQIEWLPDEVADMHELQVLALHSNRIKELSLRENPLVHEFVQRIQLTPPTLQELAGRVIQTKLCHAPVQQCLPPRLRSYLASANHCVNPNCKGVYFEAGVETVKFVDFCGKFRVPLLQFLCSPHCTPSQPAYCYSSDEDEPVRARKIRKVLLG